MAPLSESAELLESMGISLRLRGGGAPDSKGKGVQLRSTFT